MPRISSSLRRQIATAADKCANRLPAHDEFSLSRRVVAVLAISTATVLFAACVVRIVAAPGSFHWYVMLCIPAGMIAADFLSGLIHWSADTWGSESMPLIGRRILHPFRVHHVNPDDFLRRRFIDTNGDVALLVAPILLTIWSIPTRTPGQISLAVFMTSFCGIGLMTNQIHQWAHMANPPYIVRVLQHWGAILPRDDHAKHHFPPYVDNYCITTGWCNRP